MRLYESLRSEDDVMGYNPLKEEIELDEEVLEEAVPHIVTRKEAIAKLLEYGNLEAILKVMTGDEAFDIAERLGLFNVTEGYWNGPQPSKEAIDKARQQAKRWLDTITDVRVSRNGEIEIYGTMGGDDSWFRFDNKGNAIN